MRFIFLAIIFNLQLISCKNLQNYELKPETFEAKKYVEWFYTHKLTLFNQHYFNQDTVVMNYT